jgi:CelD/BcsL family acetyltransferase involved in cellulose biosynthesis
VNKINTYTSFEDLPEPCGDLFTGATTATGIFSSLPWFRNLAATVPEIAQRLRIYSVASDSGIPTSLLPMRHEAPANGLFAPRHLSAATNFYSALFAPAAVGDTTQPDLNALAAAVAADRPRWDTVDLHPMSIDSPIFHNTVAAFRLAGMAVQPYFCFGNWYLEVNGRSYQQYFETLPSTLRNTLKRKSRQLDNPADMRIKIISSVDEVAEGLAAFETVYWSSWKAPEPYPDFMSGLIRTCAAEGWLRMGVAYVGDKPAAAQVWMVCNGVASIYKLAYDEQFAQLSVGSLLTSRLMQHVIDIDGVREVDYLMGDEPYKQDWMSHRRERWGIAAFNLRTLRGLVAATRHLGGQALKNLVRGNFRLT